jgi:hypothetical protein
MKRSVDSGGGGTTIQQTAFANRMADNNKEPLP